MELILQIIGYIFYIGIFGAGLFLAHSYIKYSEYKKEKTNIANLEAKIITLKMALRVKIKVKINSFRSQFAKLINEKNEIDAAITELSDIQYEGSADFQKHFDLSRKINTLVNTERRFRFKQPEPEAAPHAHPEPIDSVKLLEEFMGPDYKNEISIIRIIKEIADTKTKLSQRIEAYNEEYKDDKKKPPMTKVEPLEFSALADINLVFQDSEIILQEMQKKHSALFFQKAAA